nr:MAG TPA: hypothetical protein [Caudoviricetes sp.]
MKAGVMLVLCARVTLVGNKKTSRIASLLHKGSLACLRLGTPLTMRKPI